MPPRIDPVSPFARKLICRVEPSPRGLRRKFIDERLDFLLRQLANPRLLPLTCPRRGAHIVLPDLGVFKQTQTPTFTLALVRRIWTHQWCPTLTERLGTVFPAGVPWAAALFCSSTPFTSAPQNRKSASKRDSLFRIMLWPNSGHAHNRGLRLLIQQMP